eukprot:343894-Amphidinium_carterae.1
MPKERTQPPRRDTQQGSSNNPTNTGSRLFSHNDMGIKRIGCNGSFLICSVRRRKSPLWSKIRTESMDVLSERTT